MHASHTAVGFVSKRSVVHSPMKVIVFQRVLALLAEEVQGQGRVALVSLHNAAVLESTRHSRRYSMVN